MAFSPRIRAAASSTAAAAASPGRATTSSSANEEEGNKLLVDQKEPFKNVRFHTEQVGQSASLDLNPALHGIVQLTEGRVLDYIM